MVGALGDRELAHDLGVVDPCGVASVRLAPVQRAVGQPHERVGVAGVLEPADAGGDGDPQAAAELDGGDRAAGALDGGQRLLLGRSRA